MNYFYLLLFIFSFSLFGQETVNLQGKIFERGTKIPLTEVNIYILPHKIKATSNAKGEFSFENVPMGECELIVNLTNYNKLSKLNICEKSTDSLKLYLEKIYYKTFETTIKAKGVKRDDQSQSLTQDQFLTMPGSFGGDPIRAAQNLPGVAKSSGSARIIVQGAAPEDTGYTINGHTVPNVFHFGGLSSVVFPEAVERVDLIPAGYGPEYSKAIGGVIGLTTKSPNEERFKGFAFMDLLNSGALIEGPIDDKSQFLVGARYSYIGFVLKEVAKKNEDFEMTAAPTYYDITSIYKRKINDNNNFKTTLVGSVDKLELVLNKAAANDPALQGNFYNKSQFYRIIPEWTSDLNAKTKMIHSIGYGKDEILVNINGRYLDLDFTKISHRSEVTYELNPLYKAYLGTDNEYTYGTAKINLPSNYSVGGVNNPFSVGDEKKFTVKSTEKNLSLYLRQEIKFSEESAWTYLPNVRTDYFSGLKKSYLQPRFQVRYAYDKSLKFRGSAGLYFQPPEPQETSKYYGNTNLSAPEARHYTLGWEKDFRNSSSNGFEIINNFFYKELRKLVTPDFTRNYINGGSGKIVGSEIQGKWSFNDWSTQIVYTYLKSDRTTPGYGTQPSAFDQTHNLNLIAGYNYQKWVFGGRFRLVSGDPYTPITGATYDADNDVYIPTRGKIYSQRFENFKQLDLRIDRKFIYDTWILSAYLDVQNVTNSKNSSNVQYSYDYSQNQKVRSLPILPTVGMKGEF